MHVDQKCILAMKRKETSLKDLVENSNSIFVIVEDEEHVEAFKRRGDKVRKLARFEVYRLLRIVNSLVSYIIPVKIEKIYHGLIVRYVGYYISYNDERVTVYYYTEYEVTPIKKIVTIIFIRKLRLTEFLQRLFSL